MISFTNFMEKALFNIAKKWIAGRDVNEALSAAKDAYSSGRHVIINRLGEYHTSKRLINETVREYQKITTSLKRWMIKGAISVKPSQVGLAVSQKEFFRNFNKIIDTAKKQHIFVWLDMESSDHTDETIEIYHSFFSRYERIGMALQANLKRTEDDLEDLLAKGAKIRLVKGAYREAPSVAYRSKEKIDKNYVQLMRKLFKEGNDFAIATHDPDIILKAQRLSKRYPREFEFQMLRGIQENLKPILIKKKFVVADYIPYGTNWLPYSIRRIRERKRNLLLLWNSLIQTQRV